MPYPRPHDAQRMRAELRETIKGMMRAAGLCPCGHVLDRSIDFDCRHCLRLAKHTTECKTPACLDCVAWERRDARRYQHAQGSPVPCSGRSMSFSMCLCACFLCNPQNGA